MAGLRPTGLLCRKVARPARPLLTESRGRTGAGKRPDWVSSRGERQGPAFCARSRRPMRRRRCERVAGLARLLACPADNPRDSADATGALANRAEGRCVSTSRKPSPTPMSVGCCRSPVWHPISSRLPSMGGNRRGSGLRRWWGTGRWAGRSTEVLGARRPRAHRADEPSSAWRAALPPIVSVSWRSPCLELDPFNRDRVPAGAFLTGWELPAC